MTNYEFRTTALTVSPIRNSSFFFEYPINGLLLIILTQNLTLP